MSEKHDGWTVKNMAFGFLISGYFYPTKKEVIDDIEKTTGWSWPEKRRHGTFKIIKVKLVEVE